MPATLVAEWPELPISGRADAGSAAGELMLVTAAVTSAGGWSLVLTVTATRFDVDPLIEIGFMLTGMNAGDPN